MDDSGHDFTQEARETEVRERHEIEHADCKLEHWQEEDCTLCMEDIDSDIENGDRCKHGELVPNKKDAKGNIATDLECPKCEIEIDRSIDNDIDFKKELR